MSKFNFKSFVEYVDSNEDYTDEQINEIFGLFKNNDKLDKLKKERDRLKGLSADKKAALDKALQDFKDGKKPGSDTKGLGKVTSNDETTWDDVLSADDRKAQFKADKAKNQSQSTGAKNSTGRNFYQAEGKNLQGKQLSEADMSKLTAYKVKDHGMTDKQIWDFIEDQSVLTIEGFKRKDGFVYFTPHMEDKFNPRTYEKLEAAWHMHYAEVSGYEDEDHDHTDDVVDQHGSVHQAERDVTDLLRRLEKQKMTHEARYKEFDVQPSTKTIYWVTQETTPRESSETAWLIAHEMEVEGYKNWTVKVVRRDEFKGYTKSETPWQVAKS